MERVSKRFRWALPVCLVALMFATSAYADGGDVSLTDPTTWWAWLMSRISVPGG